MSYKEALFFIAKCLTISHETDNYEKVKTAIERQNIDWEQIVKVSTEHYVFPALYSQYKRADLLSYLPKDLAEYMQHIWSLNEQRNRDIREQALRINESLMAQGIRPIFLKGTAFLLQDFYYDMGERMIGDIDFIVSDKDYDRTVALMKEMGYGNKSTKLENVKLGKHYPRLTHPEEIAAVEVHFRILKEPYDKAFNYAFIKENVVKVQHDILICSPDHQVLHTIFNKQTNDLGYWYKSISLRNSYDLFLLSKETDTLKVIQQIPKYFDLLNTFLASCHMIFDNCESILFEKNKRATSFVKKQIELLDSPEKMKSHRKIWSTYFSNKSRFKKLVLATSNKDVRSHLISLLKRN